VADEKAPKSRDARTEQDRSVSGEFVRRADAEQEPFRPKSTKRRALHPQASDEDELGEPELEGGLPRSKQEEEQTLRSARAPQRIRMSLRMRRVAAGSAPGVTELRAQDQIVVRLGAQVFEVPLKFLMDPANHRKDQREWRGRVRSYYAMPYGQRYIWGATAGMLKNMHQRLFAP